LSAAENAKQRDSKNCAGAGKYQPVQFLSAELRGAADDTQLARPRLTPHRGTSCSKELDVSRHQVQKFYANSMAARPEPTDFAVLSSDIGPPLNNAISQARLNPPIGTFRFVGIYACLKL
jgi:hypothetical protein